MNSTEIIYILESWVWHFAKSMPNIPHSYARKKERSNKSQFLDVAEYIKKNGVLESFYKSDYAYFYTSTHKYWVMDKNPADAEIINRAEL